MPSHVQPEQLAIIGIGCRFPGASGPDALWRLLCDGVDAIREVPSDRRDILTFYHPEPGRPGRLSTRWGGFLDDIDRFDPSFFGISPREAARMDPQQRILLEVAWEALEDAGQVPERLRGASVGVYVGCCTVDYEDIVDDDLSGMDMHFGAGTARSVLSGRLSFGLGFQGPSLTLDTACSSSLMAVHLACQSLRTGESSLALAGGVNLVLSAKPSLPFSQARMLAPDGRCKAFDASADGFVRSDGAGLVVLKPLARALADGDPIRAVIRGSAANNDGQSGGLLLTPSAAGQEAVVRAAYRAAGVEPARVQYVEAHGTGTSVGDPIEARALAAVLSEGRAAGSRCRIGSVKTNIGHTEGAAGVAGLIKVALSLQHRRIPPSLHCREPNPAIPWPALPLVVQRQLEPWPDSASPALAGVSAFGISGTNVHVVVEEAPRPLRAPAPPGRRPGLVVLSAHSPDALRAMAQAWGARIPDLERDGVVGLDDVCFTASARRVHQGHRVAVVADSIEDLAGKLAAFGAGALVPGTFLGACAPGSDCRAAFVFPGQGSQWVGMARDLQDTEPAFRKVLERCDRLMRRHVGWSLLDELAADVPRSRLEEVDVVQPALFAVQVGLAALWRSWGIEPAVVIGHSLGEVAAAHVAGILDLDDAARVICLRSRIVRRRAAGRGAMAVVGLPADVTRTLMQGHGDALAVAACNSPTTTVVSGDPRALDELRARVEARGDFFQSVRVDYASHSAHMEPLRDELRAALAGLRARPATLTLVSTVTAAPVGGEECDGAYWVRNLREPVLFAQAVDEALRRGVTAFLEVSPRPILTAAINECLERAGRSPAALPSMRQGEPARATMLASLGALYASGAGVDWTRVDREPRQVVPLPGYPWQRQRCWHTEGPSEDGAVVARRRLHAHPLLGVRLRSAMAQGGHCWQARLRLRETPELADHRVQGAPVLPAAAYAEMALAAAAEALGGGPYLLDGLRFDRTLFLSPDGTRLVELRLSPARDGSASFEVFGADAADDPARTAWTSHASGTVRPAPHPWLPPPGPEPVAAIRARCERHVTGPALYEHSAIEGVEYGASFCGVRDLWVGRGEAVARIEAPPGVAADLDRYRLHPALLDAGLQASYGVLGAGVWVPVALESLRLHRRPGPRLWSHVVLRKPAAGDGEVRRCDLDLIEDDGTVAVEARGLVVRRLEPAGVGAAGDGWREGLYALDWTERPLSRSPVGGAPGSWVILADGQGVAAAVREALEARGERCVLVAPSGESRDRSARSVDPRRREAFAHLLREASGPAGPPCRGIVHAWGLDAPATDRLDLETLGASQELGCLAGLHLVQAMAEHPWDRPPRLWIVTSGVHAVSRRPGPITVAAAPLVGLGRTIALEHPELRCSRIDLDGSDVALDAEGLLRELLADDAEPEVALRRGSRWVPRVRPWAAAPDLDRRSVDPGECPMHLEVATLGILEHFVLRGTERRPVGRDEVEIRVEAVGLNFRDVMIAMGLLPPVVAGSLHFGWECAGRIVSVGDGVEHLRVGDEVVAGLTPGCLGSYLTAPAAFVASRPVHLSPEQAATIPIAFVTAHYALEHLGRLRRGERVLIHAAAGGVGLAAVQLAQQAGAEVFATAGSAEKREFLRSLGIDHVMDSRSLRFADEVLETTGGRGVDVVLNSLSGAFVTRSLEVLGPGGRFLELGKIDVLANSAFGLRALDDNRSLFVIDLAQLWAARPRQTAALFREVMDRAHAKAIAPLPARQFSITEAGDAFRYLSQARNIGKVVVTLQVPRVSMAPPEHRICADATYLITGGLGGLGIQVARRLVRHGARHLALVGRGGASPGEAEDHVTTLREAGVEVAVIRADVGRPADVGRVLAEIREHMPPLRGVVHAAAVLDDGILLQQDAGRFGRVFGPKVDAAWLLHTLTAGTPLDFFVMFSSAASVLGSPGQAGYAAANAFLDALAHHRRARALPAVTINWGAWGDVGLAARPDRAAVLSGRGVLPMTPAQALDLLDLALRHRPSQVIAARVDWPRLAGLRPWPLLEELAGDRLPHPGRHRGAGEREPSLRERLLAADPEGRRERLREHIRQELAQVLRCEAASIDGDQPLNRLGLDSLMAVELRNRVERALAVRLPVADLLKGPTIAMLAARLADEFGRSAPPPIARRPDSRALLARLDELSDEEVEALLRAQTADPSRPREQPA